MSGDIGYNELMTQDTRSLTQESRGEAAPKGSSEGRPAFQSAFVTVWSKRGFKLSTEVSVE